LRATLISDRSSNDDDIDVDDDESDKRKRHKKRASRRDIEDGVMQVSLW